MVCTNTSSNKKIPENFTTSNTTSENKATQIRIKEILFKN